jgi:ACT domain-containing protein
MQVSMKLEIRDTPGQLVAALKPISDLGGNIRSVIHERDPFNETGFLDVRILLEMPEGKIRTLTDSLKSQGVNVLRINEERFLIRKSVILIGHLLHTDLSDTVDKIDSTGFAEVGELAMIMPSINEPTSAKMTIISENLGNLEEAMNILKDIAEEKKILVIEPLEEF